MGGRALSCDGASFHQSWGFLWPIPAYLRGRRSFAVDCVAEILSSKNSDIFVGYGAVLRTGIFHRGFFGVEMGHALVGLQRTVYESERTYLPDLFRRFWTGWNTVKLLSDALLYAALS